MYTIQDRIEAGFRTVVITSMHQTPTASKYLQAPDPLEYLAYIPYTHELWARIVENTARALDALDPDGRVAFVQAVDAGVIPTDVFAVAGLQMAIAGPWVRVLSTGGQLILALSETAHERTIAALIGADDRATVYAAAREITRRAGFMPLHHETIDALQDILPRAVIKWRDDKLVSPALNAIELML